MNNATIKQHTWNNFLNFYSTENAGRPTRLGVFEDGNDYWLEDGMPLGGIDFDQHHNSVEIMFGDEMTHTIKDVRKIQVSFNLYQINDGLDITDNEGKTTILRFEN